MPASIGAVPTNTQPGKLREGGVLKFVGQFISRADSHEIRLWAYPKLYSLGTVNRTR